MQVIEKEKTRKKGNKKKKKKGGGGEGKEYCTLNLTVLVARMTKRVKINLMVVKII